MVSKMAAIGIPAPMKTLKLSSKSFSWLIILQCIQCTTVYSTPGLYSAVYSMYSSMFRMYSCIFHITEL